MTTHEVTVTPAVHYASSANGRSPALVLVVDDSASKRLALRAILAPLGHRIVEADSGLAALRCVFAENFAVILLDVRMPEMDGFETAALIRQRDQSEMTPIIFTTAGTRQDLRSTDLFAQGAVDFIEAPFSPAELRAKVTVFANIFMKAELLVERARDLQISTDQLRLLTDAAPIGIFRTDRDNRYVYTNPRWSAITGMAPEEATGRAWHTIIGPEQRADLIAEFADDPDSPHEWCHRFEIVVPDSTPRIVQLTSGPIPDLDGGIAGWVGTLADVTAEAGAEAAMCAAWDAALMTTRMQKDFAASASHELRTPTASILGFVEVVLESEGLPDGAREFLEIVNRNALRLRDLIDDLLILGEADIGALGMHLAPTAVGALVNGVVSSLSATAECSDISLVVHDEPESPFALIDPLRFEQALTNLIANALKFTPEGGRVDVTIRSTGDVVHVEVADTGRGIDADDIDRIFDRFYRASSANEPAIKGTGLGLAIARGIVEAQNGQIDVTSRLGQGSTFTISVPGASREKPTGP